MQGLVDYGSDSSGGSGGGAEGPADPLSCAAGAQPTCSSDDDGSGSGSDSDTASDDSRKARAAAAEAHLAKLDKESAKAAAATGPSTSLLPDPLAALGSTAGAPAFLRPAATRPLAAPVHKGGPGLIERRDEPPPSKRAKGAAAAAPPAQPPAGGAAAAAVEAAQWAAAAAAADTGAGAKGVPDRQQQRSTKAMPVAEALATGAPLPRKGQTMKERQKAKAAAGQRATGEWKPEAYMIMRQQYD